MPDAVRRYMCVERRRHCSLYNRIHSSSLCMQLFKIELPYISSCRLALEEIFVV